VGLSDHEPKRLSRGFKLIVSDEPWDPTKLPPRRRWRDRPIEWDRTNVAVRGEPLHPVWWRGRQWAVTKYGIEALDGTYAIAADRLTEEIRTDYGNWPVHMAEKNWLDHEDFFTAWMVAIAMHGAKVDCGDVRLAISAASLPDSDEDDPD
jgi:hypothetical protein